MMVKVYRIEYETSEFDFKFHIAAMSAEEALAFLAKNIKKTYKVSTISEVCNIDAMTMIASNKILIEGKEVTGPIVENKLTWKCPWCGKAFEKEQGLKVHIGREHK